MDGDWFWMLLIAFVVISMMKGGRTSRQQRKLQTRLDQLQAAPPPPAPAPPGPTRAEVERLEQRVRVLERIVTDSGYTLASQIEALRDDRRIERPAATRQQEEHI